MTSLPDKKDWRFDKIKTIEPDRVTRLENAPSANEILDSITNAFRESLIKKEAKIGYEKASSSNQDKRIIIQFFVDQDLFDFFFNSRTGYRAHYWVSPETGIDFNFRVITALQKEVEKLLPDKIEIRKLNLDYDDLGEESALKSFITTSLKNEQSKIWACTKLINIGGNHTLLPPGTTGPKLIVGRDCLWSEIYRNKSDCWLDVKGPFWGLEAPYQIKTVSERSKELHLYGRA